MLRLTKPEGGGAWISHEIPGSSGFQFLFDILAREYTDAFSVDLVKVAVGGALHITSTQTIMPSTSSTDLQG
jgi:hypothetical protein